MNDTFIFTNGGAFAEALDASRGLPPQHNAHVYEYRAVMRDRNEAWREAKVIEGLTRRRNEEQARWAKENAELEAAIAKAQARTLNLTQKRYLS